ncbi:MAG TPA: hypothetical protein ENK02_10995 [Planctomycetes bacterium]|nr:hypothetical protein [Planctomycetota bacterium]
MVLRDIGFAAEIELENIGKTIAIDLPGREIGGRRAIAFLMSEKRLIFRLSVSAHLHAETEVCPPFPDYWATPDPPIDIHIPKISFF